MALFTPNIAFLNFKVDEFFGEIVFEVPGTYTIEVDTPGGPATTVNGVLYDISNDKYLIPNGVRLAGAGLTAVAVGAGGGASGPNRNDGGMGGGGGALSYMNNHGAGSLSPGDQFTVIVGAGGVGGPRIVVNESAAINGTAGGISRLVRVSDNSKLIIGNGGQPGTFQTLTNAVGGTSSGTARDGGGNGGGSGVQFGGNDGTGGGGAGGYTGNGGEGLSEGQNGLGVLNSGAGGGGAGGNHTRSPQNSRGYTGGGGVALYGVGNSGTVTFDVYARAQFAATQGSLNVAPATAEVGAQIFGNGRGIGAGGGGLEDDTNTSGGTGGNGGLRIVFGGASNPRSFPSTNVGQSGSLGNVLTVTGAAGAGDYGGQSQFGT